MNFKELPNSDARALILSTWMIHNFTNDDSDRTRFDGFGQLILKDYIRTMIGFIHSLKADTQQLELALFYIFKVYKAKHPVNYYNIFRLLLSSLLLTLKMNSDCVTHTNQYAQVIGLTLKDALGLERDFLAKIGYRAYVPEDQFNQMIDSILPGYYTHYPFEMSGISPSVELTTSNNQNQKELALSSIQTAIVTAAIHEANAIVTRTPGLICAYSKLPGIQGVVHLTHLMMMTTSAVAHVNALLEAKPPIEAAVQYNQELLAAKSNVEMAGQKVSEALSVFSALAAASFVPAATSSAPAVTSSAPAATSSVPAATSSVPAATSSVPAATSSVPEVAEATAGEASSAQATVLDTRLVRDYNQLVSGLRQPRQDDNSVQRDSFFYNSTAPSFGRNQGASQTGATTSGVGSDSGCTECGPYPK